MKRSWKTTAAGVGSLLTAAGMLIQGLASGGDVDYKTIIPAVLAGLGLLFARDDNRSSEDVGIKQEG